MVTFVMFVRLNSAAPVPLPPAEELRYVVRCATSVRIDKVSKKSSSPVKESALVFNIHALSRPFDKRSHSEVFTKTKLAEFLKVCCKISNKQVMVKVSNFI